MFCMQTVTKWFTVSSNAYTFILTQLGRNAIVVPTNRFKFGFAVEFAFGTLSIIRFDCKPQLKTDIVCAFYNKMRM